MSDLGDLPPAAILAYKVLLHEGPLTHSALQRRAHLAESSADRALRQLRDADLVERRAEYDDRRRTVYHISG
jgi:DNA-binding MarR family transcriptional regulator